ncbi:ABC transporter ATP-binding protein [Companilactobacillus metriopterae]|uniref:ABC transporter ATP-binding protein n=1 Tax=Companilactobacillus metriopterae TaxID=1909267 RepID=UPI00100A7A01|nr:ABC transporter ATP-binding protein [Companilactobacillus metriopterae]
MISFKHVTSGYGDKEIISDLNLDIYDNNLFVMVGPSGSGKTTTLKMINRLIKPMSGTVEVNGVELNDHNITDMRLKMGYVLQNIALFPNLTVEENIGIQLEAQKVSKEERQKIAYELLELVNMSPEKYANRYPDELSGGQQQRVGIVRALATKPDVILMDEPFSALDPVTRVQLQDLVLEIKKQSNSTIVFVTHDMKEALKLGTQIALMKDGKIQQIDSRENILNHPANDFVRDFFAGEHLNSIVADIVSINYSHSIGNESIKTEVNPTDTLPELSEKLLVEGIVHVKGTDQAISSQELIKFIAMVVD